jgi:tellurite resistance protein
MGRLMEKVGAVLPVKGPTDDVLLLHAMLLMAAADGVVEYKELSTVESFFNTLPEFQDKDFGWMVDEANKVIARYGGLRESLESLSEIESESVRKKCFLIAADLAMSSGEIAEAEEQVLDEMQHVLGISDAEAERMLDVLALKYVQ